jgi:hypothetical protein
LRTQSFRSMTEFTRARPWKLWVGGATTEKDYYGCSDSQLFDEVTWKPVL